MYSIMISGSALFTGEEVIRDAYVYIKDGIIKEIGERSKEMDLQEPSLVIGGEKRVIMPGLTAIASIASSPIRYYRPSMEERVRFYRLLSNEELFISSLPSVYELNMQGITTILGEAINPSFLVDLKEKVGGNYGVAIPSCVEGFKIPPALSGRVKISGEGCKGEGIDELSQGYIIFTRRVTYSMSGLENPYEKSEALRKEAGLARNVIKEGVEAEIVVFDASRPPAMMVYKGGEDEVKALYSLAPKVESLVVGQELLVDIGEHLRIGGKQLKVAEELGERVYRDGRIKRALKAKE